MRAVEEGAKEWRENQCKLKARKDFSRDEAERNDISKHLLSGIRANNVVETEDNLNYDKCQRPTFCTHSFQFLDRHFCSKPCTK